MSKNKNQVNSKGKIKGRIMELPKKGKIERIALSIGAIDQFSIRLDSLGFFITDPLDYGTYTVQIFHEETHYPIVIQDIVLDSEEVDLGTLPLFRDPFGYQAEWGELANENGAYFHYRHPMHDKGRDSLEVSYRLLFSEYFGDKKLKFETIDISTDSSNNTMDSWRFAVIENKKK